MSKNIERIVETVRESRRRAHLHEIIQALAGLKLASNLGKARQAFQASRKAGNSVRQSLTNN